MNQVKIRDRWKKSPICREQTEVLAATDPALKYNYESW